MKQNPDQIARLIALDPSETASGFDAPSYARQSQQFDPEPRRVEWLSWNDLTPAGRNLVRFCAFCAAAVLAMLIGMFVLHLIAVTAGNAAQIGGAPW